MTRRGHHIAWVVVVLLAVAASGLACLVLLGRSRPVEASEVVRLASPDGRWTLAVRDEVGPLASNPEHTSAVLARADGSEARTVYFGPPATAAWRGPANVLVVEVGSGARHVIAVSGGAYDYRFDEAGNLAAFIAYAALPGVVVLIVGALIIRRTARRLPSGAPALP